ncbi:hypothetical protein BV898_08709 [Hypsibius exemplaris]|uniref:RRM domain-containing protein n=1 Tax=Hypsibius exemplaris TaxID=2072580 RepID=A0A1W0WPJ3_HYPEX|nr:hypothetical protein BV898_08709 [Hypsibius exemplaris]
MTRNIATRKARRNSPPSFDLLVRLNLSVSSEEISSVFAHWGKVRDVHRPYEDRDYRFVRYERKEEMKAALRGYRDGSLRYLQPEWLQCTVYESPSNSLFEVIVRDVPAEITDKEWCECISKYGAVRAVHRIPKVPHGVCDMFIAMEDQRSHNVIKALLATLAKYQATLSDIFYGTFVPPASFCATFEASSKASTVISLRDQALPPAPLPPLLANPSQMALVRRISAEGAANYRRGSDFQSSSSSSLTRQPAIPDPCMFRSITILTRRKSSISPATTTKAASTQVTSNGDDFLKEEEPEQIQADVAPKKNPSDVWFSCGEEIPDAEVVSVAPTAGPPLKPDGALLKGPKVSFAETVVVVPSRDSLLSSSDDDFAAVPDGIEAVISSEATAVHQGTPLLNTSPPPVLYKLQPCLNRDIRRDSRRKKRTAELRQDRCPPLLPPKSTPQKLTMAFLPPTIKSTRESWKSKARLRRQCSDPASLKQYAALHQGGASFLELPGYFHRFRKRPTSPDVKESKGKNGANSKPGSKNGPLSLMGVPFPCDQAPLRTHYNAAKVEGRVVTIRFSEARVDTAAMTALNDHNSLTYREQLEENDMIEKWLRAYQLFQKRKSEARSPIRGMGRLTLSSPPPPFFQKPMERRVSAERIFLEKQFFEKNRIRDENHFNCPQDARLRLYGLLSKSPSILSSNVD